MHPISVQIMMIKIPIRFIINNCNYLVLIDHKSIDLILYKFKLDNIIKSHNNIKSHIFHEEIVHTPLSSRSS